LNPSLHGESRLGLIREFNNAEGARAEVNDLLTRTEVFYSRYSFEHTIEMGRFRRIGSSGEGGGEIVESLAAEWADRELAPLLGAALPRDLDPTFLPVLASAAAPGLSLAAGPPSEASVPTASPVSALQAAIRVFATSPRPVIAARALIALFVRHRYILP